PRRCQRRTVSQLTSRSSATSRVRRRRSVTPMPPSADEKSEGRTGRVLPPQGRGEQEDASRPGDVGFVPGLVGPATLGERMYARSDDARGLPIADRDVLELARLLREADFDDTAGRLEEAYDLETRVLALTIVERESILLALGTQPAPTC